MVTFCAQRRGNIIIPASESDYREMIRLPERMVFSLESNPRAPLKLTRWYWAALQLLVEATGRWPNKDVANREISIQAGYVESIVINTGGDYRVSAISKSGWGLVEWREFIDAAVPVMLRFVGETRAQFRDRVDRFFGIKFKEAWEGI